MLRSFPYKCALAVAALLAMAGPVAAGAITVDNPSFETQPAGGLTGAGCGAGCSYAENENIPGWTISDSTGLTYQIIPGVQDGNYAYDNYVPNGVTVAGVEGQADGISQTVAATAVSGATYTLTVNTGRVANCCLFGPLIDLVVGSNAIAATGSEPGYGNWAVWTASFTALHGDAGDPITIELGSTGVYTGDGDTTTDASFDEVQLSETIGVPEPTIWALMIGGLCSIGWALRTARRRALAA